MILDCAIIGGGPAGLNAALVLGRARRNVILFDNSRSRNAVTQESHGFITRDGVDPSEFRNLAHQDISKYPSVKIKDSKIQEVKRESPSLFQLITQEGHSYLSRKILIASGLKESLPNVNNIKDYYGKSIFSCPYCDGWELREQPLVIISENQHASHLAKMVYQWSKDLIVCTNGHKILSESEEMLLKKKGIRIMEERIVNLIGSDGKLEKVVFEDGTEVNRTGGFVTTDLVQPNEFAISLGCKLNKSGGIIVDALGRTNVEGVYAAGDTTLNGPSQLIISAAEGSRAAMGINYEFTMEEFK
ncbi:pyridine nucleotide-disulfide oxidoreductase [Heyndrickxia shackletonii]|uniref:Pyridine nucleotide-disulfide oxidoreductase n=1 Tax=Heyndrickxia shackletonii TaxID=157838 RepID=A0A0Q3WRH7_9BACI|nr:NAD(P)/FAD-dependent oxidoreductase [Heyndrickxia shackletonii]KQL50525.1 pyridine nucleotide-disulfide oxidoreductase [Heyndrickxia shackletonii]NEY98167.1 NAD(P)/FAD-dependent oxidoreductase [Heyndrickxia shackletonii]